MRDEGSSCSWVTTRSVAGTDPTDAKEDPTDPKGDPTDPKGDPTYPKGDPTDPKGDPTDANDHRGVQLTDVAYGEAGRCEYFHPQHHPSEADAPLKY